MKKIKSVISALTLTTDKGNIFSLWNSRTRREDYRSKRQNTAQKPSKDKLGTVFQITTIYVDYNVVIVFFFHLEALQSAFPLT